MDLKQLEAFVLVAETGSFSAAGCQLHLTQPTISAHIGALEQETDMKLFVRTSGEVYLTQGGELLYPYAKSMLKMREDALDALEQYRHTMKGTVTLSASSIPGQYFLPDLLGNFREQYPDIIFDVQITDSEDVVRRVGSRVADLGFTGTAKDGKKCVFREFAHDRLVVITPNEPRFQKIENGFPAERLLQEDFISRESGSGTRRETEQFLRELNINPEQLHQVVAVRSTESIKNMVSQGVGISIISRSACQDECSFGKLLAFDLDRGQMRRSLYLVRHKSGILSPIARVFYEFAKTFYL